MNDANFLSHRYSYTEVCLTGKYIPPSCVSKEFYFENALALRCPLLGLLP